jgi:hypothetical protein
MRRRSRKAGALIFSGQIRSGNIAGSPRIGISSGARPSVSNRFSVSVISTASSVCAACPATRYPGTESFGLRDYQIPAVEKLEKSFREERPRALVQMATGSGKTFTAITSVYRLLKYADAKRILFLVDTKNLGDRQNRSSCPTCPMTTTGNSLNSILPRRQELRVHLQRTRRAHLSAPHRDGP